MIRPNFENLRRGGAISHEASENQEQERLPIEENENSVVYLGVRLEKAKNNKGQFVPKKEQYADYINEEFALALQKKIAVSFATGDPILVEGGTSIGKTTTVKKMCADLGWEVHYANLNGATDVEDLMGRYIPNVNRDGDKNSEYIFADGKITSGLRQEDGKTKVIILDEFNAAAPNILIRLHEVLDALERGGDVVLSEDASAVVQTSKVKTKIIALTNPPGKGYLAREPLDPAQLRRWVYLKEKTDLPDSAFSHSTDVLFGLAESTVLVEASLFVSMPRESLLTEQLRDIQGIEEITAKYKEFHKAAKELLKQRTIAEYQPQLFMYDDRMEPKRVRDYVLRFYSGDINQTFQEALEYYYANKLERTDDKDKLRELIRLVECQPVVTRSRRRGLETQAESEEQRNLINEINAIQDEIPAELFGESIANETPTTPKLEGTVSEQFKQAQEIMAENFYGPAEIKDTFGFSPRSSDIPPIPYSQIELRKAKDLGEHLI
ncbi:MAG: AAA family ATPase, partial [Candidatus Falkowbacteria bacterium]|nr:AAA family ATPase [Candidatus Falkowbacteria bacterium]